MTRAETERDLPGARRRPRPIGEERADAVGVFLTCFLFTFFGIHLNAQEWWFAAIYGGGGAFMAVDLATDFVRRTAFKWATSYARRMSGSDESTAR